jgi:hypothetical protein
VDYDVTISIYDSLITLFHGVLEAYERSLLRVGDKEFLEVADYSALNRMKRELSPRSDYWKLYDWQ